MNKKRIVTTKHVVLFTDVHNFSIAAKTLGENQYGFIQEMYEVLGDIVVSQGGELIKYLGDGFLCVFPDGSEEKAIACGIKMREAFFEMVKKWELPTETELEVGLAAGEVFEGVFGHRTLKQKDVFGEAVNRAAMIGHHRGVAVTEHIYESVKDVYSFHRMPDMKLKWQDEPMKLWEVTAAE